MAVTPDNGTPIVAESFAARLAAGESLREVGEEAAAQRTALVVVAFFRISATIAG
jgi:hypothetical protein